MSLITFVKTSGQTDNRLASVSDYILWYAADRKIMKYRQLQKLKELDGEGGSAYTLIESVSGLRRRMSVDERRGLVPIQSKHRPFRIDTLTSQSPGTRYEVSWEGRVFFPKGYWKTQESSMPRLVRANRVEASSNNLYYVRYFDDYAVFPIADNWADTGVAGFTAEKRYVVETTPKVIERCILMVTDPGDLVLDPTCGSGTTSYVAEQWGADGSRSTPLAWPWPWRAPGSWAPATPTTCWPTPRTVNRRKRRSRARLRPRHQPAATSPWVRL